MSLPITKTQAHKVAEWMKGNFGSRINEAVAATPFSVDIVCGIACQETAYFWLSFINSLSVDEVLARCVLDASGDFPGTQRDAFPRNTELFRNRFGDEFTEMLISEANETRQLRGYGPQRWVYKGYGIYQYDLQYVIADEEFFREKQWYQFEQCLKRLMKELKEKFAAHHDLWKAIRAYNGSGQNATSYANNVIQLAHYCSEVGG
jgi:hypothetical protein